MSVGYVTGKGNEPGMPMSLRKARESIFGYLMALNWIARDFITGNGNPVN
jgi:2-keto-4-pentenoate hydratase/2-oxohepta-3-ene-1,7-dioic acid hydratase in catechol pathway